MFADDEETPAEKKPKAAKAASGAKKPKEDPLDVFAGVSEEEAKANREAAKKRTQQIQLQTEQEKKETRDVLETPESGVVRPGQLVSTQGDTAPLIIGTVSRLGETDAGERYAIVADESTGKENRVPLGEVRDLLASEGLAKRELTAAEKSAQQLEEVKDGLRGISNWEKSKEGYRFVRIKPE